MFFLSEGAAESETEPQVGAQSVSAGRSKGRPLKRDSQRAHLGDKIKHGVRGGEM